MDTATEKKLTTFHLSLNVSDLARSVDFYQLLFGRPAAKASSRLRKVRIGRSSAGVVARASRCLWRRRAQPRWFSAVQRRGIGGAAANTRGRRLGEHSRGRGRMLLRSPNEILDPRSRQDPVGVLCARGRQRLRRRAGRAEGGCGSRPNANSSSRSAGEFGIGAASRSNFRQIAGLRSPSIRSAWDSPSAVDWEASPRQPVAADRLPFPRADHSKKFPPARGTFNVPCEPEIRRALLAQCLDALEPGGRIVLHHLTSDARLPPNSLPLPGPAPRSSRRCQLDAELLAWLETRPLSATCRVAAEIWQHSFIHTWGCRTAGNDRASGQTPASGGRSNSRDLQRTISRTG